jgi:hypothetical protein
MSNYPKCVKLTPKDCEKYNELCSLTKTGPYKGDCRKKYMGPKKERSINPSDLVPNYIPHTDWCGKKEDKRPSTTHKTKCAAVRKPRSKSLRKKRVMKGGEDPVLRLFYGL